jgi:hypothetical protein
VPARDRGTLGESLADSDALARRSARYRLSLGLARLRTWAEVVQSAAQLCAELPPVLVAGDITVHRPVLTEESAPQLSRRRG